MAAAAAAETDVGANADSRDLQGGLDPNKISGLGADFGIIVR